MAQSKYKAEKIIIDGYTFDSKDEGRYYECLKQLKEQGGILNFEIHPEFIIMPSFSKYGKRFREVKYIADFAIYHNCGDVEIVDVKGMATETANLKRKMFDKAYPELTLTWMSRSIKHGGDSGWIKFEDLKKIRALEKKRKQGVITAKV